MTISQVQFGVANGNGGTSLNIDLPGAPTEGNLLVGVVNSGIFGGGSGGAVTAWTGWTFAASYAPSFAPNAYLSVYWRIVQAGDTATNLANPTWDNASQHTGVITEYASDVGWPANPFDVASAGAQTGTPTTSQSTGSSGTLSDANHLAIACLGISGGTVSSVSADSGFTWFAEETTNEGGGNSANILEIAESLNFTGTTAVSTTFSWTTSHEPAAMVVVFNEDAAPSGSDTDAIHAVARRTAQLTNTSNTVWATALSLSAAELTAAGFATNDEVIVMGWADFGGGAAGQAEVRARLTYNGAILGNEIRMDPNGPSSTGREQHGPFFWRLDLGGTIQDIDIDILSSTSGIAVSMELGTLVVIRLADFGVEDTDWRWAEDTSAVAHTASFVDRVSETFTPAEVEDWVVLGFIQITIDTASNSLQAQLQLDGANIYGAFLEEGESTGEELAFLVPHYISSLSAASHTIKWQSRDDSGTVNDYRRSALLIFKKSKWADIFVHAPGTVSTAGNSDVQIATITNSLSLAQRVVFMGAARKATDSGDHQIKMWAESANTNIDPVGDNAAGIDNATSHDSTDVKHVMILGYADLAAGAQDLDLNIRDSDATTLNSLDVRFLLWGMELVVAELDLDADAISETDTPTDVSLLADPVVGADLGSETDTPSGAVLQVDPLISAESAGTSATSQEAILISELALTAEAASEIDSVEDALLEVDAAEPEIAAGVVSETDAAVDADILAEPLLEAEEIVETESVFDASIATELPLEAEASSEADSASDAEFAVELGLPADVVAETESTQDAQLNAETVLETELVAETDSANDANFGPEPALSAEAAAETDVVFDGSLAAEIAIIAELSAETDGTFEVSLSVDPFLVAEPASETAVAFEAQLAYADEREVTAGLATETDQPEDAAINAEPLLVVETVFETCTAFDAEMSVDVAITAEAASETETTFAAELISELSIVVELAIEMDTAIEPLIGPPGLAPPTHFRTVSVGSGLVSAGWGRAGRSAGLRQAVHELDWNEDD